MRPRLAPAILVLVPLIGNGQQSIGRVALMPELPQPYAMRDWRQVARDYDALVFDFERKGRFLPLGRWDREGDAESFSLVSHVGMDVAKTRGEGINCLAALVGATLSGIDKSRQNGHNYVAMAQKWFSAEGVYANGPGQATGRTFWYELFPNILFYQLNALYPNTGAMPQEMLSVADRYYDTSVKLSGDYNHLSFALSTMTPVENQRWKEPDSAAGIAWLEYMAWVKTGNAKYLNAAKWGLDYLQRRGRNVYYEVLLPYGAYAAARANAENSATYDLGKLLNWCFDGDSECRRGWGVIAEKWHGIDAYGLVGSITDHDGYAFAMNTYEQLGALLPIARYDTRYARDLGKWALNAINASRLFFANAHDDAHQSGAWWAREYDPSASLSYEGLRKNQVLSVKASAERTKAGRIESGDYRSAFYRDSGGEILQTDPGAGLEHSWEFALPHAARRSFTLFARGLTAAGQFQFSWSGKPEGPWRKMGSPVGNSAAPMYRGAAPPDDLAGRVYVRVCAPAGTDSIAVEQIGLGYNSDIGPYAQGDATPRRSPRSTTDFALYGGSHVGIFGGIVRKTNVDRILQLNLLATDYYHKPAYPTYLYYNPYAEQKIVGIDAGTRPVDLYDAATGAFLVRNARGESQFQLPPHSAVVLVLVPAGEAISRIDKQTLAGSIVIDFGR